jgi:hypothetical protein
MRCFTAPRFPRRRRLVRPLSQPPACGACASWLPFPAQPTAAPQQGLPNDAALYCDAMPAPPPPCLPASSLAAASLWRLRVSPALPCTTDRCAAARFAKRCCALLRRNARAAAALSARSLSRQPAALARLPHLNRGGKESARPSRTAAPAAALRQSASASAHAARAHARTCIHACIRACARACAACA